MPLTLRFWRKGTRTGLPGNNEIQPRGDSLPDIQYHATTNTIPGFPCGANNIVMHQPTMIDMPIAMNNLGQGRAVLEILFHHRVPGAEFDSSARYPPPICHPGTRKRLTEEIQKWLRNDQRTWSMLWLYGPAGVGKSAVAQTITEHCAETGCLGAAFFFSRHNKRKSRSLFVTTLVYQLAVRILEYRRLVSHILAEDPTLLEKAVHIQFKKLIVEPLSVLPAEHKYLIVLDGLDECDGEDEQCRIVELINGIAYSNVSLPILWMISSRPEPHLKRMFARADFRVYCWREELTIDAEESREDVALYIREGFKNIYSRYSEVVEEDIDGCWPPKENLSAIVDAASGLFIFASTIIKFIGDPDYANPEAQLDIVMAVLRRSYITGLKHPMQALDMLYTQILSAVPADVLPTTLRLLHLCAFSDFNDHRSAQMFSNLVGISRSTFYGALWKLHSILDIPSPDKAGKASLRFLHASFLDYLKSPIRSGVFSCDRQKTSLHLAKRCWQLLGSNAILSCLSSEATQYLSGNASVSELSLCCLSWRSQDPVTDANLAIKVAGLAKLSAFVLCSQSGDTSDEDLFDALRNFNFNYLGFVGRKNNNDRLYAVFFSHFLRWLNNPMQVQNLPNIARTRCICATDDEILAGLHSISDKAVPFDFYLESDKSYYKAQCCPPRYFLLGYDTNTVLVIWDLFKVTFHSFQTPADIWPSVFSRGSV